MSLVDYLIIFTFFAGIIFFALYQKKKSKNQNNQSYFLAGRNIPWVVAMFSIVATETSVITFMSIPGLAYKSHDWTFLQLAIGYILGRFFVSYFFIPIYYKDGIISIYQVIGDKFGPIVQKLASVTFLITRFLADGVRFLATSVVLHIITGWNLQVSILIIGVITIFYSSIGGLKTILWIDGFQFFVYLVCGFIAIFYISNYGSLSYTEVSENGFFNIFNFASEGFQFSAVLTSILTGILLSVGSHGIDHMMVQRVLSTKSISNAKKAMIGSGVFVFIQFMIFLCVGTLIASDTNFLFSKESDYVFAEYIRNHIPIGLRGLMIAGVLSAAMSSLSSSINSLASSTVIDIYNKKTTSSESFKISVVWGLLLTFFAVIFKYDPETSSLINISLGIISFTYGGLISLFIFTKLKIRFSKESIIFGYIFSITLLLLLAYFDITWKYYIAISICSNFIITYVVNFYSSLLINKE